MLEFVDIKDKVHLVKERTLNQIYKYLATYISNLEEYVYIGNQEISKMNGNIYADFIYKNSYKVTLCVADYFDYKNEIFK